MMNAMCNEPSNVAMMPCGPGNLTELVRGTDQRLLEQMMPLVHRQCVTLDLDCVERIDAAGIAALITLYRRANESGHTFRVSNPSPRVAEILVLVGLDRILLSQDAISVSHCGPRLVQAAA